MTAGPFPKPHTPHLTPHDFLRWAAGASVALPALASLRDERALALLGIDEDSLGTELRQHRLAARFVERLGPVRPGWCSRALLGRMLEACHAAEVNMQRQVAAIREIRDELEPGVAPPLVLKGFTSLLLTGERRYLRHSADLDVLHPDPDWLYGQLERLGYAGRRVGAHTCGTLARTDLQVDLHYYFPVWRYPAGMRQVDMRPDRHPGVWRQPFGHLEESGIRYEHLAEGAVPGCVPGTEDLLVPDAAVTVLALCAHEFRHFLEGRLRHTPMVELATLASVADLARHPSFDRGRFLRLVDELQGHDSVEFVAWLLQEWLGANPLPVRVRCAGGFPQTLTPWGGWATLHTAAEAPSLFEVPRATERLGVCEVRPGEPITLATPEAAARRRVVMHSREVDWLPVELRVEATREELCFDVSVNRPLEAGRLYRIEAMHRLRTIPDTGTTFGSFVMRWVEVDSAGAQHDDGTGDPCISLTPTGCRARLPFDLRGIRHLDRPGFPVDILLLVMLLDRSSRQYYYLHPPACLIVPLRIVR